MAVEREFVTLTAADGGTYDGLFHHEPHATRVRERRTGRRTAQIHVHGIMGNFLVGTLRFLPPPYARVGIPMLVAETRMGNVGQLFGDAIPEEALSFAAQALTARLAVWWGQECLLALPDVVTDQDRSLLALAAAWVSVQNEASRNAALLRALQSPRGPGAWIALGAGWGAEQEAGHMTGQAVATGVLLALSRVAQEDRRRSLAQCIVMAQSLGAQSPGTQSLGAPNLPQDPG